MTIEPWQFWVMMACLATCLISLIMFVHYTMSKHALRKVSPASLILWILLFPVWTWLAIKYYASRTLKANPICRIELSSSGTLCYIMTARGQWFESDAETGTIRPIYDKPRMLRERKTTNHCYYTRAGVVVMPSTDGSFGDTMESRVRMVTDPPIMDAILTPSRKGALMVNAQGGIVSTGDAPGFKSLNDENPYLHTLSLTWREPTLADENRLIPLDRLCSGGNDFDVFKTDRDQNAAVSV